MTGPSTAFGGPPPLQMQGRKFGEHAALLFGVSARLLGWSPDQFWEATPAELAAAIGEPVPGDGMMSDELERLKVQFPDG